MKKVLNHMMAAFLFGALSLPAISFAQKEKEDKEKEKDKEKKEMEVITITRTGDEKEKVTIEINGDKVTVNGKPVDDKSEGGIRVQRHKIRDMYGLQSFNPPVIARNFNFDNGMSFWSGDDDRAMLGVVTEEADKGVKITDLTKEGGAEKAGLQKGDIITKVDETKIEDPEDLTDVIKKHKPGDKVGITYMRDGKSQSATAELSKWKGMNFAITSPRMPDMRILEDVRPRIRGQVNDALVFYGDRPRLGVSVQDTEDGNGVKIIDVEEDGNGAKAGLKEDDIITEINGKPTNTADEVAKIVRENRDKASMSFKVKRAGKVQTIEVKVPKKLKTADL